MVDETVIAAPVVTSAPKYAGFLVRLIAYIIDCMILGVICVVLVIPVLAVIMAMGFMTPAGSEPNMSIILIAIALMLITAVAEVLVTMLYFSWFTSSKYMGTPGKILLKLKVTDLDGNRISLLTAWLRFMALTLLNQFFYVGSLAIIVTEKKQGIYDLVLNTVVIQE